MATQAMQVRSDSQQIFQNNASVLRFQANDVDGAPIDVSSGFGLTVRQYYTTQANASSPATVSGTPTYGADGKVTLALSHSQANLQVGSWRLVATLSDDSGATESIISNGTLTVSAGV